MGSASKVHLTPENAGVYHRPDISLDAATTASRVLQENHERFHISFNDSGFHNHIAHHVLTLFALGASPSEIQSAFDQGKSYQRPQFPVNEKVVEDMADEEKFKNFFGQEEFFHDYVVFFEREIDKKGWPAVVNEYIFSGSENAELMLTRLFAGTATPMSIRQQIS